MDFFQRQTIAKRNSRRLYVLFALALAALVILVNMGVFSLWILTQPHYSAMAQGWRHYITSPMATWVSVITLVVFSLGTVQRFWQLRGNGLALIPLLKAQEIIPNPSQPPSHKQFINVVEEISVASHVPVPRLFVLPEEAAINAFVTGTPNQYALVITQGALTQLNRDELQAVVAHEFSHILHQDVSINLRMVSLLAGLVAVSHLGRLMVRYSVYAPRQPQDKRLGAGANVFIVVFLGAMLWVAGYAGLLLGRLIKAAVSRQRELLADATAVQFTRNPHGLAGALMKIQQGPGSQMQSSLAEDISHMCFADAVPIFFTRLFSTHPDTHTRLQHLGPGWIARARVRQQATPCPMPSTTSLGYARQLLKEIPPSLHYTVSEPRGASLMLYALILAQSKKPILPKGLTYEEKKTLLALIKEARLFSPRWLLPLVDLSLPAIQRLPKEDYKSFIKQLDVLIKADGHISLFEFLVRQSLYWRLHPQTEEPTPHLTLQQVATSLQRLFSALIHTSASTPEAQRTLFAQHAAAMLPNGRALLEPKRCTLPLLAKALHQLRILNPIYKTMVMNTCADIVVADKVIKVEELEMLRLISLMMESPMPDLSQYAQGATSVTP